MYFLETSALSRSCNPNEDNHQNMYKLTHQTNLWVTSKLAFDEIKNIQKRRNDLYRDLQHLDKKLKSDSTAESIQPMILAEAWNDNDRRHLEELYLWCLKNAGLNIYSDINSHVYKNTLFPHLRNAIYQITTNMLDLISNIQDTQIYDYSSYPTVHKLRKILMDNLEYANSHKNDINISCDAIEYTNLNNCQLTFISGDSYHINNHQYMLTLAKRVYSKDFSTSLFVMRNWDYGVPDN